MSGFVRHHTEWLNLIDRSGPFVEPPVLVRVFPQGLPKHDAEKSGRLRAAYEEWAAAQEVRAEDAAAIHATWIRLVLREVLEFDDQTLRSADGLPPGLEAPLPEHHETLRPTTAIVEPSGRVKAGTPRLLVTSWPLGQDLDSTVPETRWVASPLERMTRLCRSTGIRLGLVTNGERWTLVDAPVGQTAGYASWYAGLWTQEPITLAAFEALLGVRRFFAQAETDTLEAMLDESVAYQQEVTDQLGYQVRRAVEVLVQALDRADFDRERELLRDISPEQLYEASLTVMMRLVFLFCAEERGLLLLGDEIYDANYAVSTLRAMLRDEADRVGVEVLERRQDAWARLLATFRVVFGGIEHEALRLPALGGSLFDPDRFTFLEGRAVDTSWLETPAVPLPIDNRTVLHLLEALQLLRMRGDHGISEARKLSYRALDIEQIGHVYEGLLDHVAVRVDTDTLGLAGTKDKEPELSIDDLDRERRRGREALVDFLKKHTGRSASGLRNDLDAKPDEETEQRLLVACNNDKGLATRIRPYHALVRKDVWAYPQVYRAGSFMMTDAAERRQTGTHYTAKSLTERIVTETLEPLVYIGPAEGKPRDDWKLRSPSELLDLKICDMAVGSAAFLVQVCRWLGERVVEAWDEAERSGASISAEGEILMKTAGHDLLGKDREERLSLGRRLIAERCIYGVDINSMAVELAKLSLWLVTLAKGRPFGFLDHNLRRGDSLIGVSLIDQLTGLGLSQYTLNKQMSLFGREIARAVDQAMEFRSRLRRTHIRDIHDVQAMARLDVEARDILVLPERIADVLVGETLQFAVKRDALQRAVQQLATQADRAVAGDAEAQKYIQERAEVGLRIIRADTAVQLKPFHWCLEFPEVFERKNPGFDAILGNPPFVTGKRLSTYLGDAYQSYLKTTVEDSTGAADLSVFFLRRAFGLLRDNAHLGMIATKSVAEGDSRIVGTAWLINQGAKIVWAVHELPWPGQASVIVSLIGIRKGDWIGSVKLNGISVASIGNRLTATNDDEPFPLIANKGLCSDGIKLQGDGFVITDREREEMLHADERNALVIKRYITGIDIVQGQGAQPSAWVISFGTMSRAEASAFKEPFAILIERVKRYRDSLTGQIHEADFWKFWDKRERFFETLRGQGRILACPSTAKYLIMTFIEEDWIPSHSIKLFAFSSMDGFVVMQSAVHEIWAREHSGKLDQRLAYNLTKAFATFPWPNRSVESASANLLLAARTQICTNEGICLTDLYNKFHDGDDTSDEIVELRALHEAIDGAVVRGYGWEDIPLGHGFHTGSQGLRYMISPSARVELLRRLNALNAVRYKEESGAGIPSSRDRTRSRQNS